MPDPTIQDIQEGADAGALSATDAPMTPEARRAAMAAQAQEATEVAEDIDGDEITTENGAEEVDPATMDEEPINEDDETAAVNDGSGDDTVASAEAQPEPEESGDVEEPAAAPVEDEVVARPGELSGTQTEMFLVGCPAEQILECPKEVFSDVRVTRKWFDAVEVGDVLPVHTSFKPADFVPSEDSYPGVGPCIAHVEVVEKTLHPYWSQALDDTAKDNHFLLTGRATVHLEELIKSVYPKTAWDRAKSDPEDGFTVLRLKLMKDADPAAE